MRRPIASLMPFLFAASGSRVIAVSSDGVGSRRGRRTSDATHVPVCPRDRYATDPMRPTFRVTWLQITQPGSLASGAILNTINLTLSRRGFLSGLDVDLGAGVLYSGALNPTASGGRLGLGLMDSRHTFYVPGTNARYYRLGPPRCRGRPGERGL